MAKKEHISETPATQFLRRKDIAFSEHPYEYEEHGGTAVSARKLGVDEHAVVKTLVMQDDAAKPLIVLMHGDRKVSTKNLARQIGCKSVEPCKPEVANRHSGFLIGGTSPFGTRKAMPVYVEQSILDLEKIEAGKMNLQRLSEMATAGRWPEPEYDNSDTGAGDWYSVPGVAGFMWDEDDAKFIVALVNAYRDGRLVEREP